jgi:hypothetical protein
LRLLICDGRIALNFVDRAESEMGEVIRAPKTEFITIVAGFTFFFSNGSCRPSASMK